MQNRIVVPLDGSAFGKRALPFALALARRNDDAVEIVHVHERPPAVSGAPALDTRMDAEWRASMRDDLTHLAAQLTSEAGVETSARFLDGDTVPALEEQLTKGGARLVVMMTHGRGGLSHYWLGSVAEGLIRVSPVPVLLLRVGSEWPGKLQEPPFRRVLVPLDDSAIAADVLPHALALAQREETSFALVSVTDPALATSGQLAAEQRLTALADEVRARGFEVRTTVVNGEQPAQAILEFAEANAIDLIALTTHAHGALYRLFFGATADKVIRGARVPLLVYRPRGTASLPPAARPEAQWSSTKD